MKLDTAIRRAVQRARRTGEDRMVFWDDVWETYRVSHPAEADTFFSATPPTAFVEPNGDIHWA